MRNVVELNRHFTVAAEQLTKPSGQSLARWLVLGEVRDEPATVAAVAARLKLARQSVQRVADVLAQAGLCAYEDNPHHRRAKLLRLLPAGREALAEIDARQREWADGLSARVGEDALRAANAALATVLARL